MATGEGGSAARVSRESEMAVVFETEDRTGTTLVAVLTETADGSSVGAECQRVNIDLVTEDGWEMADEALFHSYRMRLYRQSGGLYVNQSGQAFSLLREAVLNYVARDEAEQDSTVMELFMSQLRAAEPLPPTTMDKLIHYVRGDTLTMQFRLRGAGGKYKSFRIEYDMSVFEMLIVYKMGGGVLGAADDAETQGYISAYEGGAIAGRFRTMRERAPHDVALEASLNIEMENWWPRTEHGRMKGVMQEGCMGAWSVRKYLEDTIKLFSGVMLRGEGISFFPKVFRENAGAEEDAVAESRKVGEGGSGGGDRSEGQQKVNAGPEGDQTGVVETEVVVTSVERADEDSNETMNETMAGGRGKARSNERERGGESDTMLEVYNDVAMMAKSGSHLQHGGLHKNQLGMFTLHVCEVRVSMQSMIQIVGEEKWRERKDFVAKVQQNLDITGINASAQVRERTVDGKRISFTLVKMRVTAAPSQKAIESLQHCQLQLLSRGGGNAIDWGGTKVRVYVWLGTQSAGDAAIFEIQSGRTFADLAGEMKDRGICSWIYRGNFQIDPLKAVRVNKKVTGRMSVMVLRAEEYGLMARWEAEDRTVKIKLASARKVYEVKRQEDSFQWVCPQDEVTIERDTYFVKVTPLQVNMQASLMREMQKKMTIYSGGQGQLDNIILGQDTRRKYYARYVGKGPDIVSLVDFYAHMAGSSGYPMNPRVEIVAVGMWDTQYLLGADVCSKCCEVGHGDQHCAQMMVCKECFTIGDKDKLPCRDVNCRWPKRGTKEETRRYETLDGNSLRRTAMKYISEKAKLLKSGEESGNQVVRMPSSVVVRAQVGRDQRRRVIAGPTTGQTFDEVEQILAAHDNEEEAKDLTKKYFRQVHKGAKGTQLFNKTTDALKTRVERGELSPHDAEKVQMGAKNILTDVLAGGEVTADTWKSTFQDMLGETNFHALQTPKKIADKQTGLTPAVGYLALESRGTDTGGRGAVPRGEKSAKRRLEQARKGQKESTSTDSLSSSTSTSTSSSDTSTNDSESDSSGASDSEGGAGRKSKRKKRKQKLKKKLKKLKRKKKRRRKQKRERKREKKRMRREQRGGRKNEKKPRQHRGRGEASHGIAKTPADPQGASLAT